MVNLKSQHPLLQSSVSYIPSSIKSISIWNIVYSLDCCSFPHRRHYFWTLVFFWFSCIVYVDFLASKAVNVVSILRGDCFGSWLRAKAFTFLNPYGENEWEPMPLKKCLVTVVLYWLVSVNTFIPTGGCLTIPLCSQKACLMAF